MSEEKVIITNAALTRTGNNQITSFTDGSVEAEVAAANYEEVVLEELDEHFWSFATREAALGKLVWTSTNEWAYRYQAPADILAIKRVFQNGHPVKYERNGNYIYCDADNSNTPLYIEYIVRIAETSWPGKFRAAIIERLEALFLRALSEDYDKAEARERDSDVTMRKARHRDAGNKSPRRPRRSRLTAARH